MTDREKLAALLMAVPPFPSVVFARGSGKRLFVADHIADHLLANGVVVREKGEWVNNSDGYPECNRCGYKPQYDPMFDDIYYSDFCPNCGADMRKGENDGQ